jgi:hypothetical protein
VFKRKAGPSESARRKLLEAARSWASVGGRVTFRAEVMPGLDAAERTFTVARVLANGRIELAEMAGQHSETEFISGKSAYGVH